jgi:cobalamin biosynthesis protein CobT
MQKLNDQNHKINSMVDVISTMTEELNFIRSRFFSSNISTAVPFNPNSAIKEINLKKELISVSDDETDEESDDENESESDDEDESEDEDESSDESEDDSEDESEDDSEDESSDENKENILSEHINDEVQLFEILENEHDEEDNIKIINISNNLNNEDYEKENNQGEEVQLNVLDHDILKSIDISETDKSSIDYKKMHLNKLKSIVLEKNLTGDVSKLKKPDLLKLLGVE